MIILTKTGEFYIKITLLVPDFIHVIPSANNAGQCMRNCLKSKIDVIQCVPVCWFDAVTASSWMAYATWNGRAQL